MRKNPFVLIYRQIKIEFESFDVEAWSNINYSSNHEKLFKREIDESVSNSDDMKVFKYLLSESRESNYGNNNDIVHAIREVYPKNLNGGLNDIINIADFDMLQSHLPAELESDGFLTSAIYWKPASIRDISTKTREIDNI